MSEHNCCELLRDLSDYIDGSLASELCANLEQHMQGCTNCQIVYNTLHKTIELYQNAEDDLEIPEGVRGRLYKRLELSEFLK